MIECTYTSALEQGICEQGFHIIDNFLPISDYQSLYTYAEELYQNGQFRNARIGRHLHVAQNSMIRNDQIHWIEEDSGNHSLQVYLNQITALMDKLNRTLLFGLVEFEAHFAIYQPGSFYRRHIDQFATTKTRRISCVYYLNENWQASSGGELNLFNTDEQLIHTVLPFGNRFICFSSELPHEVCVTNKHRYSIAGWMKTRA